MLTALTLPNISFDQALLYSGVGLLIVLAAGALFTLATNRHEARGTRRSFLSRLLYFVFLASICVLAISSFGAILQFGHMQGYALFAHISAAGAFVFLLLAIAWLYLPRGDETTGVRVAGDQRWWVGRWTAWALVISSLVAAGTMFLSMLPILDTAGLLTSAAVHRYAGLAVTAFAALHLFALTCVRFGLR